MKTEKIIASVIAAALGVTSVIPLKLSSASAAGEKYSLGDVNNDKSVDASDASVILAEYSLVATGKDGSFSEEQKKSADIDANGLIDSADAALVLSYYAYFSTGGKLSMIDFLAEQSNPTAETTTAPPKTTSTAKTTAKTTTKTTAAPKTTSKPTAAAATETTASAVKTTSAGKTTIATSTITTTSVAPTITTTSVVYAATVTTANPNKVSSIKLDRTEVYIGAGYGMLSANVTMLPNTALNKNEIWTSSDESIAVVDHEGYVTGKKEGTCIITVTSADNPEVSEKITVHIVDPSTVCNISLTQNEMSIKKGGEGYAAIVTMYPSSAKDKREKWSSSNEEIAAVNDEGWITAKKAGTCAVTVQSVDNPAVFAVILVTVYDGEPPVSTTASTTASTTTSTTASTTTEQSPAATTETTVTTNVRVAEIQLSKYEMTIPVGKRDISMVTMLPRDAYNKDEIWISSDETIASVDKYGWVKGISEGECTVTVYSVSNPEVKAEIAVKIVGADDDVPAPDVNFSYVLNDLSGSDYLTFYTPFPAQAKGQYEIEYVITDADGNSRTEKSTVLLLPELKSAAARLFSKTNNFTVTTYLINLSTNGRAKIGEYQFSLSPRDAKTITEDIYYAFYLLGGISE